MNASQLALVRESFEHLRPIPRSFGLRFYEHLFHERLGPLIIVSAASTAIALVLVPLLRLEDDAR